MKNFEQRILKKIKQKTNLNDEGAFFYKKVIESSHLNSNIVMYENVIHYIQDLFYRGEKQENPNKKINFKDFNKGANEKYDRIMNVFEKENLIDYFPAQNGRDYPRIIGYNFYDDFEFYMPTKKKNETSWNGRTPIENLDQLELTRLHHHGYEIADRRFQSILVN